MDERWIDQDYKKYIGEHYREQILVEDLMKSGSLTYRELLACFNQEMGSERGLWDFIERIRILYAAGFMRRTRISTEQIGAFVGIPRQRSFECLFERIMGEKPSDYRKHLSDQIEGIEELPRFEEDLGLLRGETKKEPMSAEEYCRKTERYIEEHPEADLHLPVLAARLGISGSYLSGLFRMYRKTTLQRFIIERRLEKACELLRSTDLEIERIAGAVGYPGRQRFERFFYREKHQLPAAWREGSGVGKKR